MQSNTKLLIIGAGPFGLAIAAEASQLGIDHLIAGKPMEFWRRNMPKGMYLRSACDWHLDPANVHTIESFLQSQNKTPSEVEPLSLALYLSYVEWFQSQKRIRPVPVYVTQLNRSELHNHFVATTLDGSTITAQNVVLAPGFKHFAHIPEDLRSRLPVGRFQHTCNFADFGTSANKQYLIIGGRQSAFEWAALLVEAGAKNVHLVHRHESPAFKVADWSWVNPLVDGMVENPNWFRDLSQQDKEAISHRMWAEGRLKVEPWLEPRLQSDRVHVWPRTEVIDCFETGNFALKVRLSNGETVEVDELVLATGYRVNVAQLPYLVSGNFFRSLETRGGFAVLDDHFETSVKGLFVTSIAATQDFGPFFGFTIAVRVSAKLICQRLRSTEP
jgi:cation diffusion facilitator CzcD-associated flavoprotein CzcO